MHQKKIVLVIIIELDEVVCDECEVCDEWICTKKTLK
jgi:hypothetical protein